MGEKERERERETELLPGDRQFQYKAKSLFHFHRTQNFVPFRSHLVCVQ